MSVQVDPIILSKLEEFRKRRRNLIVLRGLCSAVVSLLAFFTVIAVADYLVGMSENLRYALTIGGYFLVLFMVWRTCARLLLELPSKKHLARLVEKTSPELREDLLSAVELLSLIHI